MIEQVESEGSRVNKVTMFAEISKSLQQIRGEDAGHQFAQIYNSITNLADSQSSIFEYADELNESDMD